MQLDIKDILSVLPHRYPLLLIDRVSELVPGKSIRALKNVSVNEPFFTGHFPDYPVMPGVLIVEALAQAAAVLSLAGESTLKAGAGEKNLYYLAGIDDARFRKPVLPGDQIILEVEAERLSRSICRYQGRAFVDNQVVAEAKIICAIRPMDA
jgi:3-hydroxyacyl-[acyl-carrier-protein] dehydratase